MYYDAKNHIFCDITYIFKREYIYISTKKINYYFNLKNYIFYIEEMTVVSATQLNENIF